MDAYLHNRLRQEVDRLENRRIPYSQLDNTPDLSTAMHFVHRDDTSPFDWPDRPVGVGMVMWIDLTGEDPEDPPEFAAGDIIFEEGA